MISVPSWLKTIPSPFLTVFCFLILYLVATVVVKIFSRSSSSGTSTEADPEFVRDVAKQVVRAGRYDHLDMLESVEDAASYCGLTSSEAAAILDDEINVLISEQETWPKITDVNRLNAAFSELVTLGYHTGGGLVDDVGFEISKARKADKLAMKNGDEMPGYIFYRIEDVEESLSSGHPIYFWYGIPRRKTSQADELRVVTDLNAALKAQGLEPDWDGTLKSQLNLKINWQVRWDASRAKSA